MKKVLALVMVMLVALSTFACSSKEDKPDYSAYISQVSSEINDLNVFVDGADVTDGNVKFEQISDAFEIVEVDGVKYFAATLENLCPYDISTVVAFFGETTDGFVRYYKTLENAYVAVLKSEDGENFTQCELDGAATYSMILPEGNILDGITNIYMVTTPAEFSVSIKVNGTEVGVLTMSDFMKKTPVGDKKITTGMFDGSFKYNMGENTFKGRFLGIDYETMVAKLIALGMDIPTEVKEVEYYGQNGLDLTGKNTEYAIYPDEGTYFKNVSFFCMYGGMTKNPAVKDINVGLSAFINGTGSRWLTYSLTEINFVTE